MDDLTLTIHTNQILTRASGITEESECGKIGNEKEFLMNMEGATEVVVLNMMMVCSFFSYP